MTFNKVKKLGVVNYHTYREETFDIKENVIVFKAENGAGKTTLLTSLFPTLFTLDLKGSVNFGRRKGKPVAELVKENTYVFGVFNDGKKDYSIVLSFRNPTQSKNYSDVKRSAFILENVSDVDLIDSSGATLSLSEFKKKYPKAQPFTTQSEYQEWVATNIFGTSVYKFNQYVRNLYNIASSSLMSALVTTGSGENAKTTLSIDSLIQTIKDVLNRVADEPGVYEKAEDYSTNIFKKYKEENEIKKKETLYNALAYNRLSYIRKNKNVIKDINKVQEKMSRELIDLENKIELYKEEKIEISNNIKRTEEELKKQGLQQFSKEKDLKAVQEKLILFNVKEQIENKRKELSQLNKSIERKEDNLKENTEELNEIENEIKNLQNDLDKENNLIKEIGELPVLPFEESEWNYIKEQYQQEEKSKKEYDKIKNQIVSRKNEFARKQEDLNTILNKLTEEKNNYEKEKIDYIKNCKEELLDNETIEEYKDRLKTKIAENKLKLEQELNNLSEQETNNNKELEKLRNSTKPKTHFKSKNAIPLFEIIDFKENVSEEIKAKIESSLRYANLLELLIYEEETKEGVILCK